MKTHRRSISRLLALFAALSATASAADFTATWNTFSGVWTNTGAWSIPGAPGTFPNNGANTFDVIQNNGATVTVNQAITIEKFTLSAGTNTGAGFTFTVNDQMTFTGGTLYGSGVLNANGGAIISGPSVKFLDDNRVLSLGGTSSSWTGGELRLALSGSLTNKVGSGFSTDFDGLMNNLNGGSSFNNAGTFTKSAGTGTTTIAPAFNNTGTVDVNSGTISATGGGTSTGSWNVPVGRTLNFGGATQNLNAGTNLSAAGTVGFSGGTTNFNGGTFSVTGTTQINGGVANFNATANTNLLNMSSGILGGSGTLAAGGLFSFSGGTLAGSGILNANGGAAFSTGGLKVLDNSRVVNLGGTTSTWSGGELRFALTSSLNNQVGSEFTTDFNGTMSNLNGLATFSNAGTFTKSAGAGTTIIAPAFNNTGTVNANSGTISLTGGGTHTGAFSAAGGTLQFAAGTHHLNAGTSFSGAGTVSLTGGFLSVNAAVASAAGTAFNMSSGTLVGSGTLTINGPLNWSGGTMTGAGTINALGGANINGTVTIDNNRVLNLGGNSNWTAGLIDFGFPISSINTAANASLTTSFDGTMRNLSGAGAIFNNAGAFTKSAGNGTTTISAPLNNTGTVNANSGTLTLNGGVTQHSGSTLTAGTWNVTNGASINIATGSNITTIGSAASVTLDGAGSSFAKVTTALATNQGSFTLKNNRDLTTAGAYANSGTTRVEDSTTVFTVNGAYTQTGGVTAMVGGAFIDPSVFNLNGGTLQGTGTIESSAIAGPGSNTIAPGMSPGTLTINGSLTLSSGSTLAMELGGLTQGTLYDYLDVNGVLTLAGLLDLDFINDFQNSLTSGEILTLATADSAILGSFSNVASGGYLMTNYPIALQVWYGAGSPFGAENLVVVVPEPSRALLMMLGGMAVLHRRRRSMALPA